MKIRTVSNGIDIKKALEDLGVDSGGKKILAAKASHFLVEIEDLHVGAANILKQDALSVGADFAVPKGTIIAQTPKVNGLLIATKRGVGDFGKKGARTTLRSQRGRALFANSYKNSQTKKD